MAISYLCRSCGTSYDRGEFVHRCRCGGLLDLGPFEPSFSPSDLLPEERSLFRYAAALPFDRGDESWRRVSMGEGLTPLLPLDPADPRLLVKLDYAMPTLSFKDRGAVLLLARAVSAGARRIVQDSSGNAGAAVAAYAARAGIACEIFAPESTSPRKVAQIEAYGARARLVPGTREDTAAAALDAASRGGVYYASHVYDPLFYQGTKTYIFEIYEALGGRLPATIFVPLGNGTLFLGVYYGIRDLVALGLATALPRVVAVQAEPCAPVLEAWRSGARTVGSVVNRGTEAEGIAIAAPARGDQVLAALRELEGEVIAAPEEGIAAAKKELASKGLFVETTTAATYAAYREWVRTHEAASGQGPGGPGRPRGGPAPSAGGIAPARPGLADAVVLPLCGAGLKSL